MKDKIIVFIIGLLLGGVIASGAFLIYTKTNSSSCNNQNTQMNGGQPPEMPGGQNNSNGEPPEKPSGENGEPPEKPSNDSQNQNNS